MLELEPYLFFDGNAEEALNFYKGVFGGEIVGVNRYEGSPLESEMPPEFKNKIMHASFKAPTLKFMAADSTHGGKRDAGRVALSLGGNDPAEGQRVFDALAAGGSVTMPFSDSFWGAKFGMLTDKFGVEWMINVEKS